MDGSGNILGVVSTLPYGEQTINTTSDNFLFTDHERDAENGSDATLYRHYASTQGRWLAPDPSNNSYNWADPQSLNRYAYLTNRPMAKTDKLGLDDDDDDDDDDWWDPSTWFGDDDDSSNDPAFMAPSDPAWDSSGDPSIGNSDTTQPGAGESTINSLILSYNGSSQGSQTSAVYAVDNSNGLDQDGRNEIISYPYLTLVCNACANSNGGSGNQSSFGNSSVSQSIYDMDQDERIQALGNSIYHQTYFEHCYEAALEANGVSFGLNVAGAFTDGVTAPLVIAGAGYVNSLIHKDAVGSVASVVGGQMTLVGWAGESMTEIGWRAVPIIGNGLSLYMAGRDLVQGYQVYHSCMNGKG